MHNKRREMNPPHKECQGEDEGGENLLCMQRKVMNTCVLMNLDPQPCDEIIFNKVDVGLLVVCNVVPAGVQR